MGQHKLYVTIALMVAGVAVSYLTLRRYSATPVVPAELAVNPDAPVPAGDSA